MLIAFYRRKTMPSSRFLETISKAINGNDILSNESEILSNESEILGAARKLKASQIETQSLSTTVAYL
jgi:hypothetical protein